MPFAIFDAVHQCHQHHAEHLRSLSNDAARQHSIWGYKNTAARAKLLFCPQIALFIGGTTLPNSI